MADTLLGSLGKSPGLKNEGTVLSLPLEVSEPAVGLMQVTPGPGRLAADGGGQLHS